MIKQLPIDREYMNGIGMKLVRIAAGTYARGDDEGELNERPRHPVRITRPFYMGACQVTNAQYERFDPEHRKLRGKLGFSSEDDEPVIFVNWHEAAAYCRWLSEREGLPYRLPTEAEWEYACRAGTETSYSTGEDFPVEQYRRQQHSWYPDPIKTKREFEVVPLTVGQFPPNPWGLHDMHGNVEEWVNDWYGPYEEGEQTDPVGRADGEFRVSRGGSHSTAPVYLRSSQRMAALPEDRHWLLGFRVALGDMPDTAPTSPWADTEAYRLGVKQSIPESIGAGPDPDRPYFAEPKVFVKLVPSEQGPFYPHNHVPSIAETDNGDLLAVWFSTKWEGGREMVIAASRLRYGSNEWDEASLFWDAPGRNMSGSSLWSDGEGALFHINGMGAAGTWGTLMPVLRISRDNGATWSKARIMDSEHGTRRMPIPALIRTRSGLLLQPCDAETGGDGGTNLWISSDGGDSWYDPGGLIAGIHASVVEREDGSWLAFGRGDTIHGHMPQSVSCDNGRTWSYSATEFEPIGMGQRLVLRRLREGPLFFASFAEEMPITDDSGAVRTVKGLFAAVSYDDGATWPHKRLVSTDRNGGVWNGGAWTGEFTMDRSSAEPKGYLAMVQGRNGLVHLISSRIHYTFNLAWLTTPPPPLD
ncbi:glycoside hydrolase [Paenibacillus hemerocallicola]|uniref:Glycoside hydrolase n=1 Tax=Paenibacillus hemerocallicola TaxID=1172614 RepID=A0A5C4TEV7_9BACL|nr:SUMF1/EgtB/PvdO family nonheme iron enzyme [Paenibacillus hemerocallicola]TNJ67030.1 glycoside hydrolase [Paenibacillus hemerocallicola]